METKIEQSYKHFTLADKLIEQTENFENIIQTLCNLKKKLPESCNYIQQHVSIKKEHLRAVLETMVQFSGPLKMERNCVGCFDFEPGCPLLTSGFWLTRSLVAEIADNHEDLEEDETVEQVEVIIPEKWQLRQVNPVVISSDITALEVDTTSADKSIHNKLMNITGEPEQRDFYSYGLDVVCSYINRRIWLFANDDIEMYIDDMQYDDVDGDKYYLVASIKVFKSLCTSEEVVKKLGTMPIMVQPARSKMMHLVSIFKPRLCKAIEAKARSNQRTIEFHTAECVYSTDPIFDKEKHKLFERVKAWMLKKGYFGEVQDYVSCYNAIY